MFQNLLWYLINLAGYKNFIMFKDVVLVMAGLFVGMVIATVRIGVVFSKVRKVENLGQVASIKYSKDNVVYYYTQANGWKQAFEFLIYLILPKFGDCNYTLKDERRSRFFIRMFTTLTIFLVILGIVLITHPILRK